MSKLHFFFTPVAMIVMMILMTMLTMVGAGTEDRSRAVHFSSPPRVPLVQEGVRTNSQDLDPVWERERERVSSNTLKTPRGVGG